MSKLILQAICVLLIIVHEGYASQEEENLCPEITGCSCRKSKSKRVPYDEMLYCIGATDPPLHLLARRNIERILFSKNTFSNSSTLYEMKRTKAIRVSIMDNKFPNENEFLFDWNSLPDTANNVSFSNNGIHGFRSGNLMGKECNLTRFPQHFKIYIKQETLSTIPSCLPETTTVLNLKQLPENITLDDVRWPTNLTLLKLSEGGFGNLSANTFRSAPSSLETLWIQKQNFADSSWPMKLPAKSLTKLIVTHSKLTDVTEEEFGHFKSANRLRSLRLSYNELENIPKNLPASLFSLFINNNEIRHVTKEHWSTMKNLKTLDLSNNRLEKVPENMPATLEEVNLHSNQIAFSEPESFSAMKNLNSLFLSNNKLTALPRGIQPGIRKYHISNNRISLVNGPEEYKFCENCIGVQLFGNPWYCNLEMIKMLNWFVFHNVTLLSRTMQTSSRVDQVSRCSPNGLQGIDSSWLPVVLKFMQYFDQPPNNKCLYNVETLKCQNAGLNEVPTKIPPSLDELYITDNPELKEVPEFKFFNQTELWKLDLNNNSLNHIPVGMPSSLKDLYLRMNSLGDWNEKDLHAFSNLTLLRNLFLEDNNIKVLYAWQFENLVNLKWIGLSGNPLHCDCSLESFTIWFAMTVPLRSGTTIAAYPTCATPEDRYTTEIRRLAGYFSYELQCAPKGCLLSENPILNCSKSAMSLENNIFNETKNAGKALRIPPNSYYTTLYVNGLGLTSDQIDYRNLTRLNYIDLSHNLNAEVPLSGLPRSIKFLNLSHNEITVLPLHKVILQYVPNIEVLDLSNNKIQIIDSQVSNLELIGSVYLQGNPFVCNCSLRPLVEWLHVNRDDNTMIERHHLQSLTCYLHENSYDVRTILDVSEEEYCPELPLAAIVCTVVAVVLITLAIIIIVYALRQKKRRAKISEEILLGFQGLLEREKEENDPETGMIVDRDYRFDAFVSYDPNSLDAELVISLLEELEDKLGYRLCLNERDFIPGTGIADNIVECIGASKHVILVLSRSFVSSPWCQYEVQMALAELHRRRKSQLLISVLLEDISVDEDLVSSVKTFLSLVPAIKVPHVMPDDGKDWKRFWANLEELMSPPINITEV